MTKTSSRQTGIHLPQDAGDLASSWKVEWVSDPNDARTQRAKLPEGSLSVRACLFKLDAERTETFWQWSAFDDRGILTTAGFKDSEQEAKKAATLALARWVLS